MNKMSAGVLWSRPGSRVGAIISNDHKLSPTSLKWGPNIHHRTSVPVFPGSWEEAAKTWSGSHHQDASWRAGQITDDDDQAMIVSVVLPPDWLMPQTFHQAEAKHWAWERGRVTPVNRCQAASDQTCVTLIPRLVHRKLSSPVSGMSKLSLHDVWDLQCTELNVYLQC